MSNRIPPWQAWTSFIFLGLTATVTASRQDQDFLRATRADMRETAEFLLASGASVEAADAEGTTVLMWAVRNGNRGLIEALLKAGAEPRRARPDGYTLLMAAAESGDEFLFDLVARSSGTGVILTETGYSLLMAAARSGNAKLFARVRELDPHFRRTTDNGYTLLMAAAEGGQPEIFREIREVLDQPADIAAVTAGGKTVLHAAARGGSPGIIRQILESEVARRDLDARTTRGETPLHFAVRQGNRRATALLLEKGADPNSADAEGITPLHEVLDHLRTCGVQRPYSHEEEQRLVQAEECLRLLLVHGGNPNIANRAGETAAHFLATSHFPELVPMLRAANTDFTRQNVAGQTPLDIARQRDYTPMIRMLESQATIRSIQAAKAD